MLVEKTSIPLGTFSISSGVLVATDPGYDLGTARTPGLGTVIEGCRDGTWIAVLTKKRFQNENWSIPSELLVYHESINNSATLEWKEIPEGLGADTGQVGIWEMKHFHNHSLVPTDIKWTFGTENRPEPADPDDLWYSWCCELTNSENEASLMPHGIVSRSGYGDGGYPVFASRDAGGHIVALLVRFVDDKGRG